MNKAGLIIALTFLAAGTSFAGKDSRIEVMIDKKVEVSGETIVLSDIAKIRGEASDVRQLASLQLGRSPVPGNYRVLKRARVESFLAGKGWSDVVVSSPEKIEIWRKEQQISKEYILSEVRRSIRGAMPWAGDTAEVDVVLPEREISLPEGKVSLKVQFPNRYAFLGRESLLVKISVGEKEVKKLWVESNIKIYSDMVVISRPILRNEILREDDLELERRLVSSLPRGICKDISEVVGMRVKRRIEKGEVLLEGNLALPAIVKRGSMVTIVAEKDSLSISTQGRAMEKGHKGKVIKVQNVSSNKVVMAEVRDSKTVTVGF